MPGYWHGKVVLVTGASQGLGLELARAWAAAGARLALVARGQQAIDSAAAALGRAAGDVVGISCDVTDDGQVAGCLERVGEAFGRLDVLVNNAGRSTRGRALDVDPREFRELMELNFLGAVRMTRAAAPLLIASRGHLVNIGSLAGKSAARWLGAYPPTKFALTAYTQQLRLELADEGVHVLLVCPGPIAREGARTYEGGAALPEAARRAGAGVRTRAIAPSELARRILRACERRDPEIVLPWRARLLFALGALWPRLGDKLVRRMTRD